jgi:hypothetical protein
MAAPRTKIFPLLSKPGIKRDGSVFEGANYVDGVWCRFQRGRPRKIGGYVQMNDRVTGICRGMHSFSANGYTNMYMGGATKLEVLPVNADTLTGAGIIDRTPAAFATSTSNTWQFDTMYDGAGVSAMILAHASQNLLDIDSTTALPVYYGDAYANTALVSTGQSVSGGVCVLPPYTFVYGSNGYVGWSDENSVTNFTTGSAGNARIAGSKIVKGMLSRGSGGNAPSGLLWSLNSLIRASFSGGATIFRFDTITDQSSILSSNAVIEYDGIFFWPGVDRFLMYSGVVKEVPNDMNLNWFYDNLNWTYRQKVWAMKVPRYGEIWWFYPRGTATECTHAVVFNVRENTWSDVEISRSAGLFSQVFRFPVMTGTEADSLGHTKLWMHEYGVDEITPSSTNAIQSYFETADVSFVDGGPMAGGEGSWTGVERNIRLLRVEPDFIQTGDMTVQVLGRRFANSDTESAAPITFSPTTEKVDTRAQQRQMRLRFESNVQGGDYQMGQTLLHFEMGDERP